MVRHSLAALTIAVLVAPAVHADTSAGDEASKAARRRFDEGTVAYDAGHYEAARIAFQQAYAIKPHPAVLRNLGEAELRTEHFVDAATHLAAFLKSGNAPQSVERVRQSLAAAEDKIARLTVEVSVPGAEVALDRTVLGLSPLADDAKYVDPGEHVVHVKKDGFGEVDQSFVAEAGRAVRVVIPLHERGPGESAGPATPAAALTPVAVAPVALDMPRARSSAASPARMVVIAAGATLSAFAVGFGTIMLLRAGDEKSSYDEQRARFADNQSCNKPDLAAACGDLVATNDRFRQDTRPRRGRPRRGRHSRRRNRSRRPSSGAPRTRKSRRRSSRGWERARRASSCAAASENLDGAPGFRFARPLVRRARVANLAAVQVAVRLRTVRALARGFA